METVPFCVSGELVLAVVERPFCVPGELVLAVVERLVSVVCRLVVSGKRERFPDG